jgi:hypothetical protein
MYTFYEMFVYISIRYVLTSVVNITDYTNISEGSRDEYILRRIQEK